MSNVSVRDLVLTFLRRQSGATLGEFSGTGPLAEALAAGKVKAAADRKESLSSIVAPMRDALESQASLSASTVAALEAQIVAAKAPVIATNRALAYSQDGANAADERCYLPLFVCLGMVSANDAARLGYSASEFAEFSVVPKNWRPTVEATV